MPKPIAETAPLTEASRVNPTQAASGRMLIQVITPGLGSSGYYSPAVLEAAATDRLITRGTAMFLDHASTTERSDRPERSIRDIAGYFTEDARWTGEALVAEAQILPQHREHIVALAEHIGVSISGSATDITEGDVDGHRVPIIAGLAEIGSVDFVTRAGRGGRVAAVLESARERTAAEVHAALGGSVSGSGLAAHAGRVGEALPGGLTIDALRDVLTDAVRRAYSQSESVWAYVEDFDDAEVIYRAGGVNLPRVIYREGYTITGSSVTLSAARTEVRAETRYVPVSPAGSTTESLGGTMPEIEEARLRQLETDAGRVTVLESERDDARRALAEANARAAARPVIERVLAGTQLPASTLSRLTEGLTGNAQLTADGQLDETALTATATAARTQAETELAEALASAGVGRVRSAGETSTAGDLTEAVYDSHSASVFGRSRTGQGV